MVYRLCGVGSRTMSLSWLMFGRSNWFLAPSDRERGHARDSIDLAVNRWV